MTDDDTDIDVPREVEQRVRDLLAHLGVVGTDRADILDVVREHAGGLDDEQRAGVLALALIEDFAEGRQP